jgi:hypothetical protein
MVVAYACMEAAKRTEMGETEAKMTGLKIALARTNTSIVRRSALGPIEKQIRKQMMNQLTAKRYNSLTHRVTFRAITCSHLINYNDTSVWKFNSINCGIMHTIAINALPPVQT